MTKQLLPTGRAWKVPIGGIFEKLWKGLAASEVRAYDFAMSTLNRILPDNDNFTSDDAAEWERRLGLIVTPPNTSLNQRKQIILRKYQFPGNFLNRQNYRYLEAQLQLAGFDVTVTENTDPNAILGNILRHSLNNIHGMSSRMGSRDIDLIANSQIKGELYDISSPLGVFFITGIIPPNLTEAFRKLVLTLKPVNTVALLTIDYENQGNLVFVNGDDFYTVDGRDMVLVSYN
ncbi:MAG: hypothetical protein PHW73_01020 [Atribacterota bacterium]|nr:hypothetical protein [Atribacterota bacterium]